MITNDIRPLLDRYVRFIGRGNMVPASLVLVDVIKRLVLEIESSHATNGQQAARPYDVTAVNTAAIHCMDPEPDPKSEEGNGVDPEEEAEEFAVEYDPDLEPDPNLEADSDQPGAEDKYRHDESLIEPLPGRRSRGRPKKSPQA